MNYLVVVPVPRENTMFHDGSYTLEVVRLTDGARLREKHDPILWEFLNSLWWEVVDNNDIFAIELTEWEAVQASIDLTIIFNQAIRSLRDGREADIYRGLPADGHSLIVPEWETPAPAGKMKDGEWIPRTDARFWDALNPEGES